MAESIFYMTIPEKNCLCCFVCNVDPNEVEESIAKSFFHWQALKCRFLINLMQDSVIGSPVPGSDRSFYIITTKDFYQDNFLSSMFKRLNLEVSELEEITPQAYISCIKYTFQFVLAPKWNRISNQLFIKGRNFLTNTDNNPAIKPHISFVSSSNSENNEIFIKLKPFSVKLFSLKLEDLGLPRSIIIDFLNNPMGIINITTFKTIRICVLPSMRKGKLITIFKKIPDTCPFENWVDLKRHWKNMYGYRLPESNEGILFYEIYFPIAGSRSGEHFIYPDICLRDDFAQLPYKNDPIVIANKFMTDLIGVMPKMCSRKLEFHKKNLKDMDSALSTNNQIITPINQLPVVTDLGKNDRSLSSTNSGNKFDECNRQSTVSMSSALNVIRKRANSSNINFNLDNLKKIKKIHESKPIVKTGGIFGISAALKNGEIGQKRTDVNIFATTQQKIPILSKYLKASASNQENILRLSQVKKLE